MHRLSLAVNEPDVEITAGRLTCSKILDWMAFDELEPIGSTFHPSEVQSKKRWISDPAQMAKVAQAMYGGMSANGR